MVGSGTRLYCSTSAVKLVGTRLHSFEHRLLLNIKFVIISVDFGGIFPSNDRAVAPTGLLKLPFWGLNQKRKQQKLQGRSRATTNANRKLAKAALTARAGWFDLNIKADNCPSIQSAHNKFSSS